MYDVVIIGAGVTGSAVARELSRYQLKVLVLEREEDVCCGTSKANSAIVHAGFDAEPGSMKAIMNVRGNKMMKALSEELDFPYKQNGSLVTLFPGRGYAKAGRTESKRREKWSRRSGNRYRRENLGNRTPIFPGR